MTSVRHSGVGSCHVPDVRRIRAEHETGIRIRTGVDSEPAAHFSHPSARPGVRAITRALSGLRLRDRDCNCNPATFRMSEFLADEVVLLGALVDRTDHGPMLHRI